MTRVRTPTEKQKKKKSFIEQKFNNKAKAGKLLTNKNFLKLEIKIENEFPLSYFVKRSS